MRQTPIPLIALILASLGALHAADALKSKTTYSDAYGRTKNVVTIDAAYFGLPHGTLRRSAFTAAIAELHGMLVDSSHPKYLWQPQNSNEAVHSSDMQTVSKTRLAAVPLKDVPAWLQQLWTEAGARTAPAALVSVQLLCSCSC